MSYKEVLGAALQLTPEERSSLVEALERPRESKREALTPTKSIYRKQAEEEIEFIKALAESLKGKIHPLWGDNPQIKIDEIRENFGR